MKYQCPHCSQLIGHANYAKHVSICLRNPEIHARLAQALRSDVEPSRIVPRHAYKVHSNGLGLPSDSTLVRNYGSWTNVAAAFGLHTDGCTRGRNSSYKTDATIVEKDFDEVSKQLDAMRRRAEEARREQERISSSLNCREAYRGVGAWNVETHSWEFAYGQTVWAVR